jgi:hypothetical protein
MMSKNRNNPYLSQISRISADEDEGEDDDDDDDGDEHHRRH